MSQTVSDVNKELLSLLCSACEFLIDHDSRGVVNTIISRIHDLGEDDSIEDSRIRGLLASRSCALGYSAAMAREDYDKAYDFACAGIAYTNGHQEDHYLFRAERIRALVAQGRHDLALEQLRDSLAVAREHERPMRDVNPLVIALPVELFGAVTASSQLAVAMNAIVREMEMGQPLPEDSLESDLVIAIRRRLEVTKKA